MQGNFLICGKEARIAKTVLLIAFFLSYTVKTATYKRKEDTKKNQNIIEGHNIFSRSSQGSRKKIHPLMAIAIFFFFKSFLTGLTPPPLNGLAISGGTFLRLPLSRNKSFIGGRVPAPGVPRCLINFCFDFNHKSILLIFMEVFRAVYFNLLPRKYVENNVSFFKNKESLSL